MKYESARTFDAASINAAPTFLQYAHRVGLENLA
jgi:hypothetical protein